MGAIPLRSYNAVTGLGFSPPFCLVHAGVLIGVLKKMTLLRRHKCLIFEFIFIASRFDLLCTSTGVSVHENCSAIGIAPVLTGIARTAPGVQSGLLLYSAPARHDAAVFATQLCLQVHPPFAVCVCNEKL